MNARIRTGLRFAVAAAFACLAGVPAVFAFAESSPGGRPQDRYYPFQEYLPLIGMESVWSRQETFPPITVALIDTGVDLSHPELKPVLVEGVNLVDRNKPPQDDNGHGTQVAGVMAAIRNADGIAGIADNVRLMPIKALDRYGEGSEATLAEAIRYAVDRGARVAVLSVGLLKDDPAVREAVAYAERRDVLLVAAVGNNQGPYVHYPAAYPTVLAVGGVGLDKKPVPDANYGPEVDLVAPWLVYTTALGGRYEYRKGTSMAAPQVAAVAALLRAKRPEWRAFEVRERLRQTAEDIGPPGWDERTGYGLLRADRALAADRLPADPREPNDDAASASVFPLGKMIAADIGPGDVDWFRVTSPYDAVLELTFDADAPASGRVDVHDAAGRLRASFSWMSGQKTDVPVRQGVNLIRVTGASDRKTTVGYRLSSRLRMNPDAFEDNDEPYKGYVLPFRSQTVWGTFHRDDDRDWFILQTGIPAEVRIEAAPDTLRMDLVLGWMKAGGSEIAIDEGGRGRAEQFGPLHIDPGTYYISVRSFDRTAVVGMYQLNISISPVYTDPHEPNDRPYQSSDMPPGGAAEGVVADGRDEDWFRFWAESDGAVIVELNGRGGDGRLTAVLLNAEGRPVAEKSWFGWESGVLLEAPVSKGMYYLKITGDGTGGAAPYALRVQTRRLFAGFVDVEGHWAQSAVAEAVSRGWVDGYGGIRFYPDRPITRAEAIAAWAKAAGYRGGRDVPEVHFTDMPKTHWAYPYVAYATARGVANGRSPGRFAPDVAMTRAEMAAFVDRFLDDRRSAGGWTSSPFSDMTPAHWAYGAVLRLASDGWLQGYPDGTFGPDRPATRAEWIHLLTRLAGRARRDGG